MGEKESIYVCGLLWFGWRWVGAREMRIGELASRIETWSVNGKALFHPGDRFVFGRLVAGEGHGWGFS